MGRVEALPSGGQGPSAPARGSGRPRWPRRAPSRTTGEWEILADDGTVAARVRLPVRRVRCGGPGDGPALTGERPISLSPHMLPRFPGLEDRLVDRAEPPVILGQRFVRPLDIGAKVATASEVGTVVFLTNDFDGPPRLIPIARSEAVHRMVEGALNVSYYRERAVLLLSRIMEGSSA